MSHGTAVGKISIIFTVKLIFHERVGDETVKSKPYQEADETHVANQTNNSSFVGNTPLSYRLQGATSIGRRYLRSMNWSQPHL
jgi:hypothetical protein